MLRDLLIIAIGIISRHAPLSLIDRHFCFVRKIIFCCCWKWIKPISVACRERAAKVGFYSDVFSREKLRGRCCSFSSSYLRLIIAREKRMGSTAPPQDWRRSYIPADNYQPSPPAQNIHEEVLSLSFSICVYFSFSFSSLLSLVPHHPFLPSPSFPWSRHPPPLLLCCGEVAQGSRQRCISLRETSVRRASSLAPAPISTLRFSLSLFHSFFLGIVLISCAGLLPPSSRFSQFKNLDHAHYYFFNEWILLV